MRGGYARTAGVGASAAQDLAEIQPADDKPVRLLGYDVAQSSDLGDAQEEVGRYAVRRGNTVSGSGGSTPTPAAADRNDTAPAYAVEMNNTTKANTSGGTLTNGGQNWRAAPAPFWFPAELIPVASQADTTLCVELVAAPADSVTIDTTVYVVEV